MSFDFLKAIFSRGAYGRTDHPVVSVGGLDYTSGTVTYDVAHFSGGAMVVHNVAGSGAATTISGAVSQSGSWTVAVFGQARTTDPAPAAANGAQTPIITDSLGKQVVLPGAVNDLHVDGQVATPGVLAQTLIANQGAGRRIALQSILVTGSASALANVIISGGPSSRTMGLIPVGYGGFAHAAGASPLYITSASTALSVACDSTVTCNVFASGYSLSN